MKKMPQNFPLRGNFFAASRHDLRSSNPPPETGTPKISNPPWVNVHGTPLYTPGFEEGVT